MARWPQRTGVSQSHGRSSLTIQPQLRLEWQESGVRIAEQPTRRGFGTELLQDRVAYELEGVTTLEFGPNGLNCTMLVPLHRLA